MTKKPNKNNISNNMAKYCNLAREIDNNNFNNFWLFKDLANSDISQIKNVLKVSKINTQHNDKTIAVFYFKMERDGVSKNISNLFPVWNELGYKIICITEKINTEAEFEMPSYVIREVISQEYGERRAVEWASIIKRHNISKIVFNAFRFNTMILDELLLKMLNVKFILYIHQNFCYEMMRWDNIYDKFPKCISLADKTLVLNASTKEFYKCYSDEIVVISNCIDSLLNNKQSNLNNNTILWVGRIDGDFEKRPIDLINIAKYLRNEKINFKLLIVCFAKNNKVIKKYYRHINRNKLEKYFEFHINETNISKYYLESSIYLSTSCSESFGISIAEAMSFGLPVVMYDLKYLSLVDKNNNVMTSTIGNTNDIGNNIIKLLKNRELLNEKGKNNKAFLDDFIKNNDSKLLWKSIFNNEIIKQNLTYNNQIGIAFAQAYAIMMNNQLNHISCKNRAILFFTFIPNLFMKLFRRFFKI